ncbi:hypothetical protein GCM10012275_39370 [Longimycelium tulufanense]|uniref:Type II secretion system protein GspF domain-containing protein n=1 Tax=Longimycelium tulufanense TaxID=907463 RepID=A0A8J3CGE6_9PSEU|nr:type II secretion system F family protein [Longimycelium tulufanense]GGM64990.1 hypothetical protein GCM10012275_39370 [Longimycelium tulufanense]
MTTSLSLSLLAAALLVAPGPAAVRARLASLTARPQPQHPRGTTWLRPLVSATVGLLIAAVLSSPTGFVVGLVSAAGTALLWPKLARRATGAETEDPMQLAASWDVLAACLQAGLPVPAAVRAVTPQLPPPTAGVLRRVAELLALGSDPVSAWASALEHPSTTQLARAARRTARSGSALADAASTLATELRTEARHNAEACAQRAGVLVTGPLGLCFLPAFLCLGIVPVVIGLATQLTEAW